jgi:hypothetical protein
MTQRETPHLYKQFTLVITPISQRAVSDQWNLRGSISKTWKKEIEKEKGIWEGTGGSHEA